MSDEKQQVVNKLEGDQRESEFGKGLTYCIGMFLAHEWDYHRMVDREIKREQKGHSPVVSAPVMWFNGASDHLYDLVVPGQFPDRLKRRLSKFRSFCIDKGHGFGMDYKTVKPKDVEWALQEARDLLRAIDNQLGVSTIKGEWE
jgi:hypothetical protein